MQRQLLVHWNIDPDVIYGDGDLEYQRYRTVIASSATAPPIGSIVLSAEFEVFAKGHLVLAVAYVKQKSPVTTRRRRVRLEPFYILEAPIDLNSISKGLDHYVTKAFKEAIFTDAISPKLYTDRSSQLILNALSQASREIEHLLGKLYRNLAPIPGPDGKRLREERDTVGIAMDLAGISRRGRPLSDPSDVIRVGEPFGALRLRSSSIVNEDDLIAYDLSRFDVYSTVRPLSPAAYIVEDQGIRLTVINVNRKELERVHGVDLVYYDEITDQATAVQYKRLKYELIVGRQGESKWVFRRNEELERQLQLMDYPSRPSPVCLGDWRISPCPTYFKFIKDNIFDPDDAGLLKGMYVPSDYLALGIKDGSFNTGVKGGFEITYTNTRYLSRSVFVELVRKGWIGTSRTDKSDLGKVVAELAESHEVVFGIKSSTRGRSYG